MNTKAKCPYCNAIFRTSSIVLINEEKEHFDIMCHECTLAVSQDFVTLIGITNNNPGKTMDVEDAERSGEIIRLSKAFFIEVMEEKMPLEKVPNFAFIDQETVKLVKDLITPMVDTIH